MPEIDLDKLCYDTSQNLNYYFLAHQKSIPLTLIKCNGFNPIMTMPPLNRALLEVIVGITFLAFLGILSNTIYTNYFSTSNKPTAETAFLSFQPRMSPALLFGCQRPPPAPNIAPQINPQSRPSLVASKKLATHRPALRPPWKPNIINIPLSAPMRGR